MATIGRKETGMGSAFQAFVDLVRPFLTASHVGGVSPLFVLEPSNPIHNMSIKVNLPVHKERSHTQCCVNILLHSIKVNDKK